MLNLKNFKIKINFRFKIILAFVGLTILAIFFTQYVTKYFVEEIVKNQLMKSIGNLPELIRDTQSSLKFDDELVLASKIVAFKKNPDIKSIFVIDKDNTIINSSKTNEKKYTVGAKLDFNINNFTKKDKDYIQETENLIILCREGNAVLNSGLKKEFYVILSISKQKIFETINSLNLKFLFIALGVVAYSIGLALPFSHLISQKAVVISNAARKIGSGDLDFKLNIRSHLLDELDYLANDINRMTVGLKEAESVKFKNEMFKREMKIAEQIQQTLLPKTTPELERYSISSFYQSAKEVGGDYFDWIEVDENHLGIVIADVAGKGVPGAFIMAMTRSILRNQAPGNFNAAEVFSKTNALLKPDIKRGMFVTAWYGILNKDTGELTFTNAGHNPVLIYRAETDSIEHIKLKGVSLGLTKSKMFDRSVEQRKIILKPGDIVYQYTDGINEAYNEQEELFGLERLEKVIYNGKNLSAEEIVNNITKTLFEFTGAAEQSDDISMIILKMES